MLHDTTSGGGAQCWFHEAAWWTSALTGADITTLLSYLTRWTRGTRRGVNILVNGQSNAVNGYEDGAWHLMAQGVAWYIGALAWQRPRHAGPTLIGGEGLYKATVRSVQRLVSDRSQRRVRSLDLGSRPGRHHGAAYVTALPAAELADVAAIFWPWSESDSGKTLIREGNFLRGAATICRAHARLGRQDGGGVPVAAVEPDPVPVLHAGARQSDDPGVRLRPDANRGQNAWIALPQTSRQHLAQRDGNADGTWTDADNDSIHRSPPDNQRFGQRAAIGAATGDPGVGRRRHDLGDPVRRAGDRRAGDQPRLPAVAARSTSSR